MKCYKSIALFCLLVLCIQVLPVKQLGLLLSSNQLNEELPHGSDVEKGTAVKFYPLSSDPFISHSLPSHLFFTSDSREYIHFAISLPTCHEGEIHTPPPNKA